MQKCGFCAMVSGLLRRAACIGNRRGSSDSYYKELEQDTLKIEDKSFEVADDCTQAEPIELDDKDKALDEVIARLFDNMEKRPNVRTGRFLTVHKRRKKRLLTRSLYRDSALLDDIFHGLVQCSLEQSASWKFNMFTLDNLTGGRCLPVLCVHLFQIYGLMKHFQLDAVMVWKLFSLIEEGYHSSNPYHNAIHAADVTQAMHCFLQQDKIRQHLKPIEIIGSLIGAIAHDIDHPGVNQPFLIATSNHLAALYQNTSVLENHHWRSALSCLVESGMYDKLSEYHPHLDNQISSLILATDITRQQEFLSKFKMLLNTNTLDLRRDDHRHFILQIALKCADISNPCRQWGISRKWSIKVCEEFFRQGDYERKLNLPVTALCDRHTTSIPKIQSGFFKFVVTPLVNEWHRFLQNDLTEEMLKYLDYNQIKWDTMLAQELAEETKTEISDADIVEDDLETYSVTNLSGSSENLIQPDVPEERRSSLFTTRTTTIIEEPRRFSYPVNKYKQTEACQNIDNQPSSNNQKRLSLEDSDQSLHSRLSIDAHRKSPDNFREKELSTEKLLPDVTIAAITSSQQATKLSSVFQSASSSWRLARQQTYPPMEATICSSLSHFTSVGSVIYPSCSFKTDFGQMFSSDRVSELPDSEKTDTNRNNNLLIDVYEIDNLKENVDPYKYIRRGRRESAPVTALLRDTVFTQTEPVVSEQRRSSVPVDTPSTSRGNQGTPKIHCDILPMLKYKLLGIERRGSAPVTVTNELRGFDVLITRHSSMKYRSRVEIPDVNTDFMTPSSVWSVPTASLQRRSSLPVEVMSGGQ